MNARPLYFAVTFFVLLAAGWLAAWISEKPDSTEEIAARISESVERELAVVDAELRELLNGEVDLRLLFAVETTYPFFVYRDNRLFFWSDNRSVPPTQVAIDDFALRLFATGRDVYLLRQHRIDTRSVIVSQIPLRKEYPIANDYLDVEWNQRIFPSPNFTVLDPVASLGVPVCPGGECVFRVGFLAPDLPFNEPVRVASLVLLTAAIVTLLMLVYALLPRIARRAPEGAFLFLAVAFFALRATMSLVRFPATLTTSDFFSPLVFASSWINASLGDLFLNVVAVLALCIYFFKNFVRFNVIRQRLSAGWEWGRGVLAATLILFAWLFPYIVIQTMYNNSSIPLGISQSLQFDTLRIAALAIVVLSGGAAFLFSHPFISLLSAFRKRRLAIAAFLGGVLLFAGINSLTGQVYFPALLCGSLNFFLVFLLKLHKNLKRLSYGTFAYLFVGIFFLSINGAWAIQHFTQKEKIQSLFRFASSFLIDRDIFAEFLLKEAADKISSDAFVQTRFMSPFLGKEPVRQKIRQVFLPTYLNKYDIRISLYNSYGLSLDNPLSATLRDVMRSYQDDRYRTEYDNVFFIQSPERDIAQQYLMVVPVVRAGNIYGYIVVELSLKKIIPETVYPELLVDRNFQQFYHTRDLNYAVFANKELVYSSGEFNYENFFDRRWLDEPDLYAGGLNVRKYDHIGQEDQSGRIAVVSTPATPAGFKVANFSFLFVLGLFVILVLIFIQGVYHYLLGRRLFFSARIQLYLNLAFFVPLILVSLTTLRLTSRSSQDQLSNDYLNKSRAFGQQLATALHDSPQEGEERRITLTSELVDLAKLSNLDANVYNLRGELLATSQPLIFESNLLSPYMNAYAYYRILRGENQVIASEQVGKLRFYVAYTAMKSPRTGELKSIVGIPFFQSLFALEQVQTTILANILNVFAVICIVLLLLSYFVSEWLTFPLRFITQSLRRTSLTGSTPLTWTAHDEIGMMVREYNSMLLKLGESKVELENTQREKAWREIAQQVAHEIKNPLTPMKLTLQQLERALQAGTGSPEKTRKAIATLLGQVDTLNEIASSFSGFAKMPEPVMAPVDVIALLRRIVDLHSPTGEIRLRTSVRQAVVMADEQLLGRTFSNLILNGLQSGRPGQATRVSVTATVAGTMLRIDFADNGAGIDDAIADRIFLPHFSTKKSGSGLGLAISRQAVQQMNGKISFKTTKDSGTTFSIELPLIGSTR